MHIHLPTVAPAPVGKPNCSTTCGSVSVPYPFGISPGCYLPGFNLTCNTSYSQPRLLVDKNGTLEVIEIFLPNSTMRIIHHTSNTLDDAPIISSGPWIVYFDLPEDIGDPFMLSTRNELILFGCDLQATLYKRKGSNKTTDSISHCASTCSSSGLQITDRGRSAWPLVSTQHNHGGVLLQPRWLLPCAYLTAGQHAQGSEVQRAQPDDC